MVKDTKEICDAYGLVACPRRGKNFWGELMYTIDGVLYDVVDDMEIKVQIQWLIEWGRWRYIFMWKEDPVSRYVWDVSIDRFNDDGSSRFQSFDTLEEVMDDIYDFVPGAIEAYRTGQLDAGDPDAINDGSQDEDD